MPLQPLPTFDGQSVTLLAAARFIRQRHFNHACGKSRDQVSCTEVVFMLERQLALYFLTRHLASHNPQQALNFPGNFPGRSNEWRFGNLCQRVRRQANQIGAAPLIRFKYWSRRAIGRHGPKNLGHARGAPFRQIQLFQELANAPVTVATTHHAASFKISQSNRTVWTREAQNKQLIAADARAGRPMAHWPSGLKAPVRSRLWPRPCCHSGEYSNASFCVWMKQRAAPYRAGSFHPARTAQ